MAPTILRIADLGTMTVEAEISEADIGDIKAGMNVYFTTLGGRQRRWYSQVRQILPTPAVENNVVLYTGLFDIENQDAALLPEMTAQVYFVTASAQNVLIVPMGALNFLDRAAPVRGGAGLDNESIGGQAGRQGPQQVNQSPAARGDPPESGVRRRGVGAGNGQGRDFPMPGTRAARPAQVTLVGVDGSQREQRVLVGVNSRISAEVLEGLKAGDKVIAGVLQNDRASAAGGRPGGGFGSPARRFGQ
jgi:macrolide-specific efflux system membrane fusion protein